jgi:hypothetical protein
MSIIRPFRADDLFRLNNMCVLCVGRPVFIANLFFFALPSNLDIWTETVRCCVVLHFIRRAPRPTLPYPNPRTHSHLRELSERAGASMHAWRHAL